MWVLEGRSHLRALDLTKHSHCHELRQLEWHVLDESGGARGSLSTSAHLKVLEWSAMPDSQLLFLKDFLLYTWSVALVIGINTEMDKRDKTLLLHVLSFHINKKSHLWQVECWSFPAISHFVPCSLEDWAFSLTVIISMFSFTSHLCSEICFAPQSSASPLFPSNQFFYFAT